MKKGCPLYTDEELLQRIRDKAQELGRPPYKKEVYHSITIIKRFGKWTSALKLAGLKRRRLRS